MIYSGNRLHVTSDADKLTQSGVFPFGGSDHCGIFCTRKVSRGQHYNKHHTCKIRCMKNYNVDVFIDKIRSQDWFQVINCENVNKAWSNFKTILLDVIDSVAPVKEIRLKQGTKSWFNGEILDLVHRRDKALIDFRKTKDVAFYNEYKMLRNTVQHKICQANRNFIKNEIEENKNCSKGLWKTLKQIGLPSKSKNSATNIGLKCDDSDEIIFDSDSVASKFNTFFCNIPSKLVQKLKNRNFDTQKLSHFYKVMNVKTNSFSFTIVTEEEVLKILSSLNISKSTGCDNISAKFVKDGRSIIVSLLAYVINLSLRTGVVPSDFKMARVIPLFKKGNRNTESNYRPVSILPVLSKVFEKIVYIQFYSYLCDHNLIYKFQSGFRAGFSTDTALSYLCDKIKFNMDAGLYTGLVMLDLQKAFDTVDHNILLQKIKASGAKDNVVNWFNSYVSDRQQAVHVNGSNSTPMNVTCGVPQGSILGPLLFIIYVNDMAGSVNCDLFLYADDSAIIVNGKDVYEIESKLSAELEKLSYWLDENKLSLHFGKTKSILFASRKRLSNVSEMNIKCNNVDISSTSKVKYLGAVLDQDMSGVSMGTNAVKKINSVLKFLYRNADVLDTKCRKLICSSLIQCRFDYACNMWYCSVVKSIKVKLQSAQNTVVRFIINEEPRYHLCTDNFKNVIFLDVQSRVDYLCLNQMYNIANGSAPKYMLDFIPRNVSKQHTRHSNLSFNLPQVKTPGSQTFKFNGVKLWNSLPDYLKCAESKNVFKYKCKKFLLKKMCQVEAQEFLSY